MNEENIRFPHTRDVNVAVSQAFRNVFEEDWIENFLENGFGKSVIVNVLMVDDGKRFEISFMLVETSQRYYS